MNRTSRSAGADLVGGPRAHGHAAVLLGCHVRRRLGQLSAVASQVLEGAVPLAVFPVDRRLDHDGAVVTGAGEGGVNVRHPHANHGSDASRLRRPPVAATIGDNHRPLAADSQLGSVALADPGALDEAECGRQERYCGAYVRVDEDGHDHPWRHRAVDLHRR